MSYPTIDHRGPECGPVGPKVQDGIKTIFKTTQPVRFPKGATRAVVVLASSAFGTHIAEWSGINLRILIQQKGMILIMRVRNSLGHSHQLRPQPGWEDEIPRTRVFSHDLANVDADGTKDMSILGIG
jgi:hypothetical protein